MEFEFFDDAGTPYGFLVKPKYVKAKNYRSKDASGYFLCQGDV